MARVKSLHVNGKQVAIDSDANATLLSVLRDQLDLTGTKYGCGEGQCAACTVLIDGFPRHSCQARVGAVASRKITTIEGIAENGKLHPLQQAFLDEQALQCGYCTSGMIMTGVAFLQAHANPSEDMIRGFMQGNICRCGTYPRILAAFRRAAEMMRKQAG